MEYFRDNNNQIYADVAYRLGKIINQYEKIFADEEKFESTLYLAFLQNLLTQSSEYFRSMIHIEDRNPIFNKELDHISTWGITNKCYIKNTYSGKIYLRNFIQNIRNALSHPTNLDLSSNFPSTGYSTIKNNSGSIAKYCFVDSPDSKKNRPKTFQTKGEIERWIYNNRNTLPFKITFEINNNNRYFLQHDEKTFARIAHIELSVRELGVFVKHLANYLAQPIQEKWDGITINELIEV